jgi:hypothetical protein
MLVDILTPSYEKFLFRDDAGDALLKTEFCEIYAFSEAQKIYTIFFEKEARGRELYDAGVIIHPPHELLFNRPFVAGYVATGKIWESMIREHWIMHVLTLSAITDRGQFKFHAFKPENYTGVRIFPISLEGLKSPQTAEFPANG